MGTKYTGKNISDIESSIERLKRTYSMLNVGHAKEVRIMLGDHTPLIINDFYWPTREIKREYMKRIRYRVIELQSILLELKGEKVLV